MSRRRLIVRPGRVLGIGPTGDLQLAVATADDSISFATAAGNTITPPPPGTSRFIRPVASGSANGSSWANAAALSQLTSLIGPGITINIRADEGPYANYPGTEFLNQGGSSAGSMDLLTTQNNPETGQPWQIPNGSYSAQRLILRGVDVNLNPMLAVISGGRRMANGTPWVAPSNPDTASNVTNWTVGSPCIRMTGTVNDILFDHIRFEHFGNGALIIGGSSTVVRNIEIANCLFYDCQRGVEQSADATYRCVHIHDTDFVGFSKAAVRLRGPTTKCLVKNCEFDSHRQVDDNFSVGGNLDDSATHITFVNVYSHDNIFKSPGGAPSTYWNADGFKTERNNNFIQYIDCISDRNSDGGWDDKGKNVTHLRCIAKNCQRNYREHANMGDTRRKIDCESWTPRSWGGNGSVHHSHFDGSVPGTGATAGPVEYVRHGFHDVTTGTAPLLRCEGGEPSPDNTVLNVRGCKIFDDLGNSRTLPTNGITSNPVLSSGVNYQVTYFPT